MVTSSVAPAKARRDALVTACAMARLDARVVVTGLQRTAKTQQRETGVPAQSGPEG